METRRNGNMDMETGKHQSGNGKRKSRRFSLIRVLFAHCANRSLSFVRLLTKKQTEVMRLQID
jgi:hypothetical protein